MLYPEHSTFTFKNSACLLILKFYFMNGRKHTWIIYLQVNQQNFSEISRTNENKLSFFHGLVINQPKLWKQNLNYLSKARSSTEFKLIQTNFLIKSKNYLQQFFLSINPMFNLFTFKDLDWAFLLFHYKKKDFGKRASSKLPTAEQGSFPQNVRISFCQWKSLLFGQQY